MTFAQFMSRAAIFLLVALTGCAAEEFEQTYLDREAVPVMPPLPQPHTINIDDLLGKFEAVAFESEYGRTGGESDNHALRKWDGPLSIAVTADTGIEIQTYWPLLRGHLNRLSVLTGLAVVVGEDLPDANVQLNFVPRRVMRVRTFEMFGRTVAAQNLSRIGRCSAATYTNDENAIRRAIIYVSVDLPAQQLAGCIIEENVQALGLLNDTNKLRPSLFSDRDSLPGMPWYDEILVATLYDERLKAGMERDKALPLARQVIEELLPRFRPRDLPVKQGN